MTATGRSPSINLIVMPVVAHVAMTKRAVESALAQDIGNVLLYTADNGSTDGCGQYLRSLDSKKTIYRVYSKTRSLNRVWNDALSFGFERLKLPYILFPNNDVVLHKSTYTALVNDGGLFVTAVGRDTPVDHETLPAELPRRPHPDFSCFLIRRECWDRVGRFDERYWAYCSDADYHLRMHRLGIEAVSLPIPFFHESSGTLKYADAAMRNEICHRADADRATFEREHGCAVGSAEYYRLFEEACV